MSGGYLDGEAEDGQARWKKAEEEMFSKHGDKYTV
jgi:hypothetical protein